MIRNRTFAISVVQKLQEAGFEALFAGGCVRDQIMGRDSKDYDVATSALPDDVRQIFSRTVPVGEAFNVILVLSEEDKNPIQVEVATFRKDIGISDGRHPSKVEKATAKEDVERRDFTINGMLFDPIKEEAFDWVGGKEDLEKKIIRCIGDPDLRIEEDHLRMLRAVRFAARFNFKIDDALQASIKKKSALIEKISPERIYDELTKMLTDPHPDRAFNDMADLGLLGHIMPEALEMKGCEQPPEYHPEGDVWVHTMLLLKIMSEQDAPAPAELAWGCLLHDIGKPPTFSHEEGDRIRFNNHQNVGVEMAQNILRRLRGSNHLIDIVSDLTRDHLRFVDAPKMRPAKLKRFLRDPHFDLHLRLHYIDCMASHEDLTLYKFCQDKLEEIGEEQLAPEPLISGSDLIKIGYKPSRQFKEILESVETEQLESRLSTKEEALKYVEKKFARS
jgi:poly(A) polymerase